MNTYKIQVILGSTRHGRFGEQPARWIEEKAKEHAEFDVEFIDLRNYPLPFFDEPVSPSQPNMKYVSKEGESWAKKIGEADGYVWVTPEYNHGYPAVLKNAIDYVYKEWIKKPVAFVAYGSVGGARAVEQLRGVAAELQMTPVRSAVHINEYWNLLDEKGMLKTQGFEYAATNMLDQLMWWTIALQEARLKDQTES